MFKEDTFSFTPIDELVLSMPFEFIRNLKLGVWTNRKKLVAEIAETFATSRKYLDQTCQIHKKDKNRQQDERIRRI